MSGVRRFLSRREKSPQPAHGGHTRHFLHHHDTRPPRQPDHFGGVFSTPEDASKKSDKEEEKTIKALLERTRYYGIENLSESNVKYALRAANPPGDPQDAFRLLMLLEDTYEGIVKPYNPEIHMKGAVNRQNVTCYLDALLFAMFAKLDSFEAMLYENFDDAKRKRLAGLLRLWVNMLRTGKLITVDVTEHIQKALADLGWLDASKSMQQDPSEAFTFITGQLELPMLTLKMDMFHTGKEDPQDDHKFINERLLEVAILDQPSEGNSVITLEDCLEHYFNNRIEVKRHLENQRRNTLKSAQSFHSATKMEKESGTHIEVVDLGDSPDTPTASTPMAQTPNLESPISTKSPFDKLRPTVGRRRGDSIFSQRKTELIGIDPEAPMEEESNASVDTKGRKMSTRTEVLMPAWQFFKLLPWYTDNMPTSDAQVAAHFSRKRPVLGICLKRYSYTNEGLARRLDTYVDIPLEIAVPNFVGDDNMDEAGPLVGNFRLMLQSVVCHRGVSVNSGHYTCLCRGPGVPTRPGSTLGERSSSEWNGDFDDQWMRFDDLAQERITPVDIREALRQEMPYLLFYQVVPIGDDGYPAHGLPSYAEATSRSQSESAAVLDKVLSDGRFGSGNALAPSSSDPTTQTGSSVEITDFGSNSERGSLDAAAALDQPRGRPSTSNTGSRRQSTTYETDSMSGSIRTEPPTNSIPTTPSEERNSGLLAIANKLSSSRHGGRLSRSSTNSKNRPHSTDAEGSASASRFSLNMTRLTQRVSRTDTPAESPTGTSDTLGDSIVTENGVLVTAVPVDTHDSRDSAATTIKPPPRLLHKEKSAMRDKRRSDKPSEERDCTVM